MTPVFGDAWYYLALLNRRDTGHEGARTWSRANARPVVLTDFVLIEVGDAFSRGRARERFLQLVGMLRSDPNTTVVAANHQLVERGLRLFAKRHDKDWSLTDCISFVVMREQGITDALTADRHFEQAGFNILLK
jgi:predicted nucleic acid-binding protein